MLAKDAREDTMATDGGSPRGGDGGVRTFAAGMLIGALVGAGLALLLAPRSGEETRHALRRKARRLADEARERYEEAREQLRRGRERRRREHEESSAG